MNIYVGNLSRDVTEADLKTEFEAFGEVKSVTIIKDRYSGEPRGFAFIEMPDKTQGQAAVTGLKNKQLKNRTMDVSEARPRTDRGGGPGGGRRGGGFGGGGGRGRR